MAIYPTDRRTDAALMVGWLHFRQEKLGLIRLSLSFSLCVSSGFFLGFHLPSSSCSSSLAYISTLTHSLARKAGDSLRLGRKESGNWVDERGVVDLVRTENIARGPFGCLLHGYRLPCVCPGVREGGQAVLCVLCVSDAHTPCAIGRCAAQLVDLWSYRASPPPKTSKTSTSPHRPLPMVEGSGGGGNKSG